MSDQERLAKLVLMLSSDRDGEVVSAARAIGRTLRSGGTDWHAFAARLLPIRARARQHPDDIPVLSVPAAIVGAACTSSVGSVMRNCGHASVTSSIALALGTAP